MDCPDIPDFLRVTNNPAWRQAPLAMVARRTPPRRCHHHRFDLPKTVEPAGLALLKQIERQKKERQAAKFAALRERARR